MKKPFLWLAVGCAAGVAVWFGVSRWGGGMPHGMQGGPVEVVVQELQPQSVPFTTELAGRVAPFLIAEVRPQVSGIIQKRLFEEGSDVREGDVLYQIDPAVYQAQYDSAKASLARAEANVLPARLKMNRFKNLVSDSAVSKQDYEDAEAAYKQAAADVGVNRAAVENARIRLEYTRVKSPISGRISRSQVTPGALVTENQGTALASVQQIANVYVDVTQSSTAMLRLKRSLESGTLQRSAEKAELTLFLEDGTAYAEHGSLQFSEVSVDESTGSVTLRAVFPNPRQDLLPGMYVRILVAEGTSPAALLLPQEALVRDPKGNASAWVVTPQNVVESRPVRVGRTHEAGWVVLEGLKAGDKVVVEGLQRVRPNAPVQIVPAGQRAAHTSAGTQK